MRPSDRPPMDREMRRDDPAGLQGPPPDLRDLLSRRHRATAPAGFRPHALDQRLLGAGGAIPESLPLSFVLVLTPGGFAIQKPPASAEEMTGPAPSLKDALEAAGTMLHPYDRSSRSLLQAVDAGRMPSGLLDGIPLKYVDGAALCEVRDYRGRSERRVAAACRRYVAVLHPTAATVAADAEELCAQLDVVAPVTGRGYWARLAGVNDAFGARSDAQVAQQQEARVAPHPSLPGTPAGGAKRKAGTGAAAESGAGDKSRREREADAAARAAAQLCRRLAVEGALLAATSAPLCLDPDPAVAASRRAETAANAAPARAAAAATLCWSRRTRPPFRVPEGVDEPPMDPAAAREWRRRRRWLAEPAELQPSLGPDSGFEWYERRAERGDAREWAEGAEGAEGADTDGGGGGGARWACYGDVEESPLADPLRGRTLWGAPEAAAMPPPARPVAAAAARWHVEDQPRVNRTDDDDRTCIGGDAAPRPHVRPGWSCAGTVPAATIAAAAAEAKTMNRRDEENGGAGAGSTGVPRVPTHPATPAAVVVKTEVEGEVDVEREGTDPAVDVAGGPSAPSNLADVLERERVGGEEDPDSYDDRDEPGVDPSLDGGHLRLRADKRASGWRVVADPGSIASRALESRKRRRDAAADKNGGAGGIGVRPVRFKKGPGAALDASAAPSSLALVDHKPTVMMQHYDPEWAANLHPKESIRPLRYVGCAARYPHEKAPESESAYNDSERAAETDLTNNGPHGNVDLHFRMDVGPGSVTQALKDAAPASEEEPVIFELQPFTSKDHAGRFVLAFHKQATKEGLVHFRPPGGSMAAGTIDPFKPPSRPGSAPPPQTQPPSRPGSAPPPQTQPPTQAGSQQQQQQQQQQRVLQQQRSLDQARAQAREMLIHQGGMSNS